MAQQGEEHVNTDRARAGSSPHVVRYILLVSIVLVILAFAVIVLAY